jgi:Family of unknown function (DUF6188)
VSQLSLGLQATLQSVWFDDFSWHFRFSGEVYVRIESLWRLVRDDRVRRVSNDHGHSFGLTVPVDAEQELRDLLVDVELRRVEISDIGDLRLEFANHAVLEALVTSAAYESYLLKIQEQDFIGMGGGRVQKQ